MEVITVRTTFRKVSEQSAKALFSGRSGFFGGNTETEKGRLSLFGNKIAWIDRGTLHFTLGGWNTPTTKERLNAIFYRAFARHEVKVFQKKGKLYVSVQNIYGESEFRDEFNSLLDKENEWTNQFVVYLIEPDKTYTLTETVDQKIVYLDEV
jgi:hypothetical protein